MMQAVTNQSYTYNEREYSAIFCSQSARELVNDCGHINGGESINYTALYIYALCLEDGL